MKIWITCSDDETLWPTQTRGPGPGYEVDETTPVPGHDTIHNAVIADIRDRERKGNAEYGGPHRLHNGLDGLREAYEEALDMALWLRQEIEERKLTEGAHHD